MRERVLLGLLVILVLLGTLFFKTDRIDWIEKGDSYIYLVYSPTCPHCHALMDYVSSVSGELSVITTTDGAAAYRLLAQDGLVWNYGVPVLMAQTSSGIIALQGFPTGTQYQDGYFMSLTEEMELCEQMGGQPVFKGELYQYCIQPDGFMLGNMYSVDALLDSCKDSKCARLEQLE